VKNAVEKVPTGDGGEGATAADEEGKGNDASPPGATQKEKGKGAVVAEIAGAGGAGKVGEVEVEVEKDTTHLVEKWLEKDVVTERRIYKQVGLLCHVFCFRESVWNHTLPGDKFALRLVEQDTEGIELEDVPWRVIYVEGSRASYELACQEHDPAFDPLISANTAVDEHNTLYAAVLGLASEDGQKRARTHSAAMASAVVGVLLFAANVTDVLSSLHALASLCLFLPLAMSLSLSLSLSLFLSERSAFLQAATCHPLILPRMYSHL
jgi:hypothetical protein